MKKIIYLIVVSLFWVIPSGVYALDELEKEYKALLEYYNKEIISKTEEAKGKLEIIESAVSYKNKALQRGVSSEYRIAEAKEEKTYRKLNNIKDQLYSLNTDRKELKIKVLQKYGSLPNWWVEPDIEKEKICSLSPNIHKTFNLVYLNL
jgi:hypothetical protein